MPILSKDRNVLHSLTNKLVVIVDHPKRRICVNALLYIVDKPKVFCPDVPLFAEGGFQKKSVIYNLWSYVSTWCLYIRHNFSQITHRLSDKSYCKYWPWIIFLLIRVKNNWVIGHLGNLYFQVISELGASHHVLRPPYTPSFRKPTLTVVNMQQLANKRKLRPSFCCFLPKLWNMMYSLEELRKYQDSYRQTERCRMRFSKVM